MEIKGIKFFSSLQEISEQSLSSVRNEVKGEVRLLAQKFRHNSVSSETIQVTASAGENWDDLVKQTVEKGLYGLENLSYIPGTVGASVVQNIGAYGVEVKDVVDWVEVFDIKTGEIKKVRGLASDFGYRDSIFKKPEGKNFIVIRVAYNLQKEGKLKTDYKDIQNWITSSSSPDFPERDFSTAQLVEPLKNPSQENRGNLETPKQLREIIIDIRKNKLPDWKKIGTVGSFFKNPVITKEQLNKLLEKYPKLPHYNCGLSESPQFKIPLAYILDKILGLKGFKEGGVGLYENQPLVVVVESNSSCREIKKFVEIVKIKVRDKTGLDIDTEVVIW